jgi:Protein of unknown function (DUF1634)
MDVEDSPAERVLATITLIAFWAAFISLGAGLAVRVATPGGAAGESLLRTGLIGLMTLPILRVAATIATASRTRDWLLLKATLAVLAILLALTVRDAMY